MSAEFDDVLTAARKVVHEYHGGVDAIAMHIGRTPKYLREAVEPNSRVKLNVNDAIKISNFTGDHRILEAFGKPFGLTFVKLPPPTYTTDDPKLHLTACSRGFAIHLLSGSLFGQNLNTLALADATIVFGEFTKVVVGLMDKKHLSKNDLIKLGKVDMALSSALLALATSNPSVPRSAQLASDLKAVVDCLAKRLATGLLENQKAISN